EGAAGGGATAGERRPANVRGATRVARSNRGSARHRRTGLGLELAPETGHTVGGRPGYARKRPSFRGLPQERPMRFETFGIIGYGHFGQFLASSLARHGKVLVYDADEAKTEPASDGFPPASLDEVATADAVILAVPFAALAVVLDEIRDRLGRETVVMDVVSSK